MIQQEFEALQVGDVVVSDQGDLAVVFDIDHGDNGVFAVFQDDGNTAEIYDDEIDDWSVVSRVITRENVQAKGGS